MRILHTIPLALLLVGCSPTSNPPVTTLTAGQAKALAQQAANDKAEEVYGQRPFLNGAPARVEDGQWIWRDRRACGTGDLEAAVIISVDGSLRSVNILLLDSRSIW